MFQAFYVEQGELVMRGGPGSEDHPVICSSEGVRQGDVLGPLLFCIGLKPAIDNALRRYHQLCPTKPIEVCAYMDDITVLGTTGALVTFFPILKEELSRISLMVNESKTVCTDKITADSIKCVHDLCPKLLGSYVSADPALEKRHLDGLPKKHEQLFNRLPLLPAEIGFRLLTLCGVPRWAHIVRTHEPEVSTDASENFTSMVARSACNILRVDFNHLSDLCFRQMCLPVRFGGLGLHNYAELAKNSYLASLNGDYSRDEEYDANAPDDAQEVARDVYWEEVMDSIKQSAPDFFQHLQRCSKKMSRYWLQGPITVESSFAQNAFRGAVLHRLRWAGANPLATTFFKCACGFPTVDVAKTTTQQVIDHIAGCTVVGGATRRHNMCVGALAWLYTMAGHTVGIEEKIGVDAKGGTLRMDIVSTPPSGPKWYTDMTVVNSASRTAAAKEVEAMFEAKDSEKKKKYLDASTNVGAVYKTFACDVFGSMWKPSLDLLNSLAAQIKLRHPDPEDRSAFTSAALFLKLSRAIAFGNGLCLVMSGRLSRLGFHPDKPLPRIESALSVAAEAEMCDNVVQHGAEAPACAAVEEAADEPAFGDADTGLYFPPDDDGNNDTALPAAAATHCGVGPQNSFGGATVAFAVAAPSPSPL